MKHFRPPFPWKKQSCDDKANIRPEEMVHTKKKFTTLPEACELAEEEELLTWLIQGRSGMYKQMF